MSEHDPIICIDVGTYAPHIPPALVLWDCDKTNKITTIQGQKWECGWCPLNEKKLSGCNETKYLFHACKIPKQGFRPCYGQIPPMYACRYRDLYEHNLAGKHTKVGKY